MTKYNIVQSYWFSSAQSCIGVVEIENSVGEHKFYIGIGNGYNKEADEEFIADLKVIIKQFFELSCLSALNVPTCFATQKHFALCRQAAFQIRPKVCES